jgi:WD40 repeat protein
VAALMLVYAYLQQFGDARPRLAFELSPKGQNQSCLLFSPDGKFLIVGSRGMGGSDRTAEQSEGELSIWQISSKEKKHVVSTTQHIRSVSFPRNGDFLAVAVGGPKDVDANLKREGKPREVRIYSFPGMKEKARIPSQRYVTSAIFSPDGKLLAIATESDEAGEPAKVEVLDAETLKPKYVIDDLSARRTALRFSTDGSLLALIDSKKHPKIEAKFPTRAGQPVFRIVNSANGDLKRIVEAGRPVDSTVTDFWLVPDDKNLIANFQHEILMITDGAEPTRMPDRKFRTSKRDLALSSDGQLLAIGVGPSSGRPEIPSHVIIWDVKAKKTRYEWPWNEPSAHCVAISPDKKFLAVGSDKVYLFELK